MARWDDDDGDEVEAAAPRRRSLPEMVRRVAPFFAPHRRTLALGAALLVVATVTDAAAPLALRHLIDVDLPTGGRGDVVATALVFLALHVTARAADYVKAVVLAGMGLEIVTGLKRRLFGHILGQSMAFFDKNPAGRLLARVESDTERLLALFTEVGLALVGSAVMLLATLAMMLWADWRITLVVVALLVPVGAVNFFVIGAVRSVFTRGRRAYAEVCSLIAEHVQAAPIVQAFSLERDAMARLARRQDAHLGAEARGDFLLCGLFGVLAAIEVGVIMVVLGVGRPGDVAGGGIGAGTLVLFVEYARRLFLPILLLSEQMGSLQRAFAAADRVFDVLDTPSRTPERPDAIAAPPRAFEELRFEDVRFAYEGADQGAGAALDGISIAIRRGERVALVGRSGGGKSTLFKLLLRFHEPTSGRITVDGQDVRAYTHEAWRSGIGLVLQDVHLFPATLRQNLTVFRADISDEAVLRALRTVHAEGLLERLPGGLDAQIEEGGHNLSQGERQLVCFARAVVREPTLLLLDEATSSVDPGTERAIHEAMEAVLSGRTSVTIAHRLATVLASDRILVIDRGRVIEDGTHAGLLRQSALYGELCRLQLQAHQLDASAAEPGDAPAGAADPREATP